MPLTVWSDGWEMLCEVEANWVAFSISVKCHGRAFSTREDLVASIPTTWCPFASFYCALEFNWALQNIRLRHSIPTQFPFFFVPRGDWSIKKKKKRSNETHISDFDLWGRHSACGGGLWIWPTAREHCTTTSTPPGTCPWRTSIGRASGWGSSWCDR